MPRDSFEPDATQSAFERLRRAERCADALRALLREVRSSSDAYEDVLGWLKYWERAVFSRRLELDALWKERRASQRRDDSVIGVCDWNRQQPPDSKHRA